jgi:peptide-methionine (S)-S-oxide reductase
MRQGNSPPQSSSTKDIATLGGGCFWCTEAIFSELRGIEKVASGYSGGTIANPKYEQVSSGTTGHAEVIQITFDSKVISYREILEIFFTIHDPTTLNRQGNDVGTQYRSIIFYHNEQQKATVKEILKELTEAKLWDAPIVTQLEPFKAFYKAEDYHQQYFRRYREQPYCRLVITPKIAKLRKHYRNRLKKS